MEIICFEKKAFGEFAMKIEQFFLRVSNLPHLKDGIMRFFQKYDISLYRKDMFHILSPRKNNEPTK